MGKRNKTLINQFLDGKEFINNFGGKYKVLYIDREGIFRVEYGGTHPGSFSFSEFLDHEVVRAPVILREIGNPVDYELGC